MHSSQSLTLVLVSSVRKFSISRPQSLLVTWFPSFLLFRSFLPSAVCLCITNTTSAAAAAAAAVQRPSSSSRAPDLHPVQSKANARCRACLLSTDVVWPDLNVEHLRLAVSSCQVLEHHELAPGVAVAQVNAVPRRSHLWACQRQILVEVCLCLVTPLPATTACQRCDRWHHSLYSAKTSVLNGVLFTTHSVVEVV